MLAPSCCCFSVTLALLHELLSMMPWLSWTRALLFLLQQLCLFLLLQILHNLLLLLTTGPQMQAFSFWHQVEGLVGEQGPAADLVEGLVEELGPAAALVEGLVEELGPAAALVEGLVEETV